MVVNVFILWLLQGDKASSTLAPTEGENIVDRTDDQSVPDAKTQPDLFEENFKELKKWVDVKSKYGTLLVIREQRCGRPGTALKVSVPLEVLQAFFFFFLFFFPELCSLDIYVWSLPYQNEVAFFSIQILESKESFALWFVGLSMKCFELKSEYVCMASWL